MSKIWLLCCWALCLASCKKGDSTLAMEVAMLDYALERRSHSRHMPEFLTSNGYRGTQYVENIRQLQLYFDTTIGSTKVKDWAVCDSSTQEWLNGYQQLLLETAKQFAIPAEETFGEDAIGYLDCMPKLAQLLFLEEKIIAAYSFTASGSAFSTPISIVCRDTLPLGDTLVIFVHPRNYSYYSFPDSIAEPTVSVFVPSCLASLSHSQTEVFQKSQSILFECVPTQRGQHYVEIPFTMQTKVGAQYVYPIGRLFFVE